MTVSKRDDFRDYVAEPAKKTVGSNGTTPALPAATQVTNADNHRILVLLVDMVTALMNSANKIDNAETKMDQLFIIRDWVKAQTITMPTTERVVTLIKSICMKQPTTNDFFKESLELEPFKSIILQSGLAGSKNNVFSAADIALIATPKDVGRLIHSQQKQEDFRASPVINNTLTTTNTLVINNPTVVIIPSEEEPIALGNIIHNVVIPPSIQVVNDGNSSNRFPSPPPQPLSYITADQQQHPSTLQPTLPVQNNNAELSALKQFLISEIDAMNKRIESDENSLVAKMGSSLRSWVPNINENKTIVEFNPKVIKLFSVLFWLDGQEKIESNLLQNLFILTHSICAIKRGAKPGRSASQKSLESNFININFPSQPLLSVNDLDELTTKHNVNSMLIKIEEKLNNQQQNQYKM